MSLGFSNCSRLFGMKLATISKAKKTTLLLLSAQESLNSTTRRTYLIASAPRSSSTSSSYPKTLVLSLSWNGETMNSMRICCKFKSVKAAREAANSSPAQLRISIKILNLFRRRVSTRPEPISPMSELMAAYTILHVLMIDVERNVLTSMEMVVRF